MDWNTLLSTVRVGNNDGPPRQETLSKARGPFERDWDRIIFSSAFRRLHDKTQVFPLPGSNDVVHSRLTHSLEVASVGRMLGMLVGEEAANRTEKPEFTVHDVGAIVAAAALAHDIGNAPLGHAGERSIRDFFSGSEGRTLTAEFDEQEQLDFARFDGNPQGFRLLTSTHQENDGGMQLTAATLAAYTKYPWASSDARCNAKCKFGFYKPEAEFFKKVAKATGLAERGSGFAKHPLALLVEAADDICNSILDLEDGIRLRLVTLSEVTEAAPGNDNDPGTQTNKLPIAQFRAKAIEALVEQVRTKFVSNYDLIMRGEFSKSLTDDMPTIDAWNGLAKRRCYRSPSVLELEMAGHEAIGGLLKHFANAVVSRDASSTKLTETSALHLLRSRGVLTIDDTNSSSAANLSRLYRVIDYVSGMTDGYAFELYRRIAGIELRAHGA